jgi:hypothetical protein
MSEPILIALGVIALIISVPFLIQWLVLRGGPSE